MTAGVNACFYGELYTLDQVDDFHFVCFKESPDGLDFPDTHAIIFSEQTFDNAFTTENIKDLDKTSYSDFYDLAF